jgi:pilus assembly protein FimV
VPELLYLIVLLLAVNPAPEAAPSVAPESVARELPKAKAAPPAAAPSAPEASTHTVQAGETLERIAQASRRAGVTVDQMIVAIFRANPDAFIRSNLNRLRAGSVLTIPSTEEATAIALDEARRVIAESRTQPDV